MIDRKTDKLTLVHFPRGAGGKFLINALSISDDCVFAHANLIREQLQNRFTDKDKLDYLQAQLAQSRSNSDWNDLNLGCWQQFGLPVHPFAFANPDLHFLLEKHADPIMHALSVSGKRWFITTHDTAQLRQLLQYWPNAKVIVFMNFEKFLRLRQWWSDRPSHIFCHEVFELDTHQVRKSLPSERVFEWNCEWYLDEPQFSKYLPQCARWLNICPCRSEDLSWYFSTWKSTIITQNNDARLSDTRV